MAIDRIENMPSGGLPAGMAITKALLWPSDGRHDFVGNVVGRLRALLLNREIISLMGKCPFLFLLLI